MEFRIALRRGVLVMACLAGMGATIAYSKSYSWRYKIIVTVDTPEGEISGYAVRQMGNGTRGAFLSQGGNPANVQGEAVVVDLGKRGVLFARISSNSDLEFYNAFRSLWPHGGSTPEGIKFYASLPIGTKGVLDPLNPPGYPELVTFTDLNDPKSATLAQIWVRRNDGTYYLKEDRIEDLFGKGVSLKDIKLEISEDPVTRNVVTRYLSWLPDYYDKRLDGNKIGTVNTKYPTANAFSAGSFLVGGKK